MNYIDPQILREFAEAPESDTNQIWEQTAQAASRLFDRACDAEDDFFAPALQAPATKTFPSNGTAYLRLAPYLPSPSPVVVEVNASLLERTLPASDYILRDNYLIFRAALGSFIFPSFSDRQIQYKVTARFGFAEVPADIKTAVIEQALMMWRRKDLAFTELSGVSTAVASAPFSPTFGAVSEKYRGLYSGVVIG